MDKETLSNYGWIVICVMILAVMIALATPFGSFIAGAIKSTTQGLFDVNKSALDSTGLINIDNQEFDVPDMNHDANNGGNAVETIIPEGGEYIAADGTVYNPGDEFPETVTTGDTFTYGDYIYRYNYAASLGYYSDGTKAWNEFSMLTYLKDLEGWGVMVRSTTKTSYGEILSYIQDEPVICLMSTFHNCKYFTVAPEIPETIIDMRDAFWECTSLEEIHFIPDSVIYMGHTFYHCSSLVDVANIPNGVTDLQDTFSSCGSLVEVPNLPTNLIKMGSTFSNCYSLTTVPAIPASVTNMNFTFIGCESLTGTLEINANPEYYEQCFSGCSTNQDAALVLSGTSTKLVNMYHTKSDNSNITLYNNSMLVTFTINETEYKAESGMTWREWVESDYSKGEWVINECSAPEDHVAWAGMDEYFIVDLDSAIPDGAAYVTVGDNWFEVPV